MKNEKLEQKIGFNHIKNDIKTYCLSESAQRLVDNINFSASFDNVQKELSLTDEFKQILMSNSVFPDSDYFDMRSVLERLKVIGSFISTEELFNLKYSLKTICDALNFFEKAEEGKYPLLKSLCSTVYIDKGIVGQCNRLIDEKGEIYDSASGDLIIIRSSLRRKKSEVDRKIQGILSVSKREGWSTSDAEITVRDNHLVIPLNSSYKRKIKGLVHDESSSGQTSYIEPEEIVELNNELKELYLKEKKEIIKILTNFTELLRPQIEVLLHDYYFLVHIDFLRAKAKYAMAIGAGKPILNNSCTLSWFDARHPLLEKSLQKNNRAIVPLTIELNEKDRILIISGPNAGGKSVCLKTVGLLQYMLQCGLLVPMRETSECGIFSAIHIDIGDEQSLENDLSTYSSHLLNMKLLCKKADSHTLFMIDECGTGTDPAIGGAIAESVLEYLNKKNAFGIVTTHYSNLKLLADKNENIINGAMLFDRKNMKPIYKLSIGKPGSSFAFEIAKTIGLENEIIESAINKIGTPHLNFEQQLQQLEVEKLALKKKQQEVKVADELLADVLKKYNNLKTQLEEEKNKILKEAKTEAKEIIQNANRQVENTIAQIKEVNADKEQTKIIRKTLKLSQSKLEKELSTEEKGQKKTQQSSPFKATVTMGIKTDSSPLQIGDIVKIGSDNNYAEITAIRGKKLEVESNSLKLTINADKVIKVDKSTYVKQREKQLISTQSSYSSILDDVNEQKKNFSLRLDVRGQRAENALEMVDKFIDQAALLGERELSILHGTGNGILKTLIRDYLHKNSNVKNVRVAKIEFGGEGITEVTLF